MPVQDANETSEEGFRKNPQPNVLRAQVYNFNEV